MIVSTHYNPWLVRGNAQAKHALHRFFSATEADAATAETQAWTPRVDVREDASRFVILADLPGVDPADIEIQMDKGVLSLKGERKPESRDEGTKPGRLERIHGRFDRRFALPDSADADGITAAGKHGVLEISIPKNPESTPRRIRIDG
jgi:HSP20 family protein